MSLERGGGRWTASRMLEPLLRLLSKRLVGVWFEMWQLEMGNHYKAISNLFGWRAARKPHVWCHVSDTFDCLQCKKRKESDQWQQGSWNHPFALLTVHFSRPDWLDWFCKRACVRTALFQRFVGDSHACKKEQEGQDQTGLFDYIPIKGIWGFLIIL